MRSKIYTAELITLEFRDPILLYRKSDMVNLWSNKLQMYSMEQTTIPVIETFVLINEKVANLIYSRDFFGLNNGIYKIVLTDKKNRMHSLECTIPNLMNTKITFNIDKQLINSLIESQREKDWMDRFTQILEEI